MIGQDAYVIAYPDRDFAVIESLTLVSLFQLPQKSASAQTTNE